MIYWTVDAFHVQNEDINSALNVFSPNKKNETHGNLKSFAIKNEG